MLLHWLEDAVAFAIIAVACGFTIGLLANRRRWPAKRVFATANFAFVAALTVISFFLEILLRLELPWLGRDLAQRGLPFSTAVAVGFTALFAWLAGTLAQRVNTSAQSDS
jgi:hypothetical protein